MAMDLGQFYDSIRMLICDLRASGNDAAASRLRAGMDGTVSSEVLGNIGLALTELQLSVPGDFRPRIDAAIENVKAFLPEFRDARA